jgi:hypothetical protein
MIKTRRRREKEDPGKQTRFMLRGRVIDEKDIARFERRAIRKGLIGQYDTLSDQGQLYLHSYSSFVTC